MVESLYYVYIVQCRDDTLYTGLTNDITARIAAHNAGKGAKYTKGRLPVSLVYSEIMENKSAALRREIQIKKLSKSKKLKLLSKEKS